MDFLSSLSVAATLELGVALLVSLVVVKVRNTARPSFVFFVALAALMVGAGFAVFTERALFAILAVLAAELVLLVYSIIVAADIPRKREERRKRKIAEYEKNEAMSKNMDAIQDTAARDHYEQSLRENLAVNKDFIMRAADAFLEDDSMTKFLEYTSAQLTQKTKADGCVILLVDEFGATLKVRSMSGAFPPPFKLPDDLPHKPLRVETNFRYAQFPLSDNIFGQVASDGEAAFIPESAKDPRIYQNGPEDFLECGGYMLMPLKTEGEVIGVAAVSRGPSSEKFTKQEFEDAKTIVDAASTAIRPLFSFLEFTEHRELTKEGDIATKFQKTLIPEKVPAFKDVSVGVWTVPAAGVCGDWYDIIPTRKDRLSFVMADIAGKGMMSFVVMVMLRAMTRLSVNTTQPAGKILSWINRGLCTEKANSDHFASVVLVNYNPLTREAQIAPSGINPVLIFSAQKKTITKIDSAGDPLGVEKENTYKDIETKLDPGDIIVTCTDGALEALNEDGAQFSIARLKAVIEKSAQLSGRDIANRIKDAIKKHCGEAQQYDDQSVMVVKVQA